MELLCKEYKYNVTVTCVNVVKKKGSKNRITNTYWLHYIVTTLGL